MPNFPGTKRALFSGSGNNGEGDGSSNDGGGGGFDPESISGLQFWLKADALSGLLDNDPVSLWPDSSLNGADATTLDQDGVYKTGIINGLPVVRFTYTPGPPGAQTGSLLGGTLASPTLSKTLFIVTQTIGAPSSLASTGREDVGSPTGDSGDQFQITIPGFLFNDLFVASTGGGGVPGTCQTSGGPVDANNQFNVLTYAIDGGTGYSDSPANPEFYSGTSLLTNDPGFQAGPITPNPSTYSVGGKVVNDDMGLGIFNVPELNGDIAEILYYNSKLSPTNIAAVQAYLMTKYGIV